MLKIADRAYPVALTQPLGVFVHGLDAYDQQVLGADKHLLDGYLPLQKMQPRTALTEIRLLPGANVATVELGVYRLTDLKRFQTTRMDGSPWQGDAVTLAVTDATDSGVCLGIP